ncbi:MAG TPA: hypothetical protein VLS89_16460 [Candidatus Nanopelagicales bacterium]|nr:hypothetical protein [Candidatus Nanopelagicales bacterium]
MKRWISLTTLALIAGAAVASATGCELITSADRSLIPEGGAGGGQGGSGGTGGEPTTTSGGGMGGGTAGMGGMGGTPGLGNGSACTAAGECQSGFCVDGVCCNAACDSTCAACTTALKGSGNDGECGPVAIGTDPGDECTDETATNVCGQTGSCNGDSACEVAIGGTSCGDLAGCSMGTQTGADICDGSGTCVQGNDVACEPFVCDAAGVMCLDMCSANADCISTYYCNGVTCSPKLTNGTACQNAAQCNSGFCVDGRCCDTACNGLCQACSMAKKVVGANGVCGPIAAGNDPDNECGTECMISNCNAASMCSAPMQAPNDTPCGMSMTCQSGACP